MAELTPDVKALLEEPNLASFVTLMPNGKPQVTPLWVDHDGENVLVNTAEGRQKALNSRRNPYVALLVIDRNNTQRYVQVRGKVIDVVGGEEAWQHISKLSAKYRGNPNYPRREGEERIMIRIRPDHVTYRGGSSQTPRRD
jgi:PPOX class probable F420-dependent enzyme